MSDYKKSIYQRTTLGLLPLIEKVRGNNRPSKKSPEDFKKLLNEILLEVAQLARENKLSDEDISKGLEPNASRGKGSWTGKCQTISESHRIYYSQNKQLTDEKAQIAEIENSTQLRNLLYRGLTAIIIGLIIISIYGLAQCLGVNMPLRMPV